MWYEKFTNKHGETKYRYYVRSIKIHSQTNGDVLAWFSIRMENNHRKRLKGS